MSFGRPGHGTSDRGLAVLVVAPGLDEVKHESLLGETHPFAAWRMGGILALPLPWRSRMTRYLSIAVIPLLIATPVFGQSLVEAAKKAQEQRECTESPSRVWTNADLPAKVLPR